MVAQSVASVVMRSAAHIVIVRLGSRGGDLAHPFAMSGPAVTKHLKVLERAGLISRGRAAQQRPARLEPAPLKAVSEWIQDYRRLRDEKFDRLDTYLEQLQTQGETK